MRFLLVGLVLLSAGCQRLRPATTVSPNGDIVVRLLRKTYDKPEDAYLQKSMPSAFLMTHAKLPSTYTPPPGVTVSAFVQVVINPKLRYDVKGKPSYKQYGAILTSTTPSGMSDAMYIDWNSNLKFEASEAAPLANSPTARERVFKPSAVPKELESVDPVFFVDSSAVTICPNVYFEGAYEAEGKKYPIRLVDTSLDGLLKPGSNLFDSQDILAVDYDSDGKLAVRAETMMDQMALEAMPFKTSVQMPDGKFFVAEVAGDSSTLTLKPDPNPVGVVRLGANFVGNAYLKFGEDVIHTPMIDHSWILRAGTYSVEQATYIDKSPDGEEWLVSVAGIGGGPNLYVTPDRPQTFSGKGPYRLFLQRTESVGYEYFALWVANGAGAYVCPILHRDGTPPGMGTLRISDERGKTVATLPLRAWGPSYAANWRIGPNDRGPYTVRADWTTPLFGHLTTELKFKR